MMHARDDASSSMTSPRWNISSWNVLHICNNIFINLTQPRNFLNNPDGIFSFYFQPRFSHVYGFQRIPRDLIYIEIVKSFSSEKNSL